MSSMRGVGARYVDSSYSGMFKSQEEDDQKVYRISADGLNARVHFNTFPIVAHMDDCIRESAVGLLCGMIAMANSPIWYDKNFIVQQAQSQPNTTVITLPFTYNLSPNFYKFLDEEPYEIDPNNALVKVRSLINVHIETTYISSKIFAFTHRFSYKGVELAEVQLKFGVIDMGTRRLVNLPSEVQSKVNYLRQPLVKPETIAVEKPSASNCVRTRRLCVAGHHIDKNGHCHMSSVLSMVLVLYTRMNKHLPISSLSVLIKQEIHLTDTLLCHHWSDPHKQEVYFVITKESPQDSNTDSARNNMAAYATIKYSQMANLSRNVRTGSSFQSPFISAHL